MEWLVASIVVSVVLTIVLNAGLRVFPGAGERAARRLEERLAERRPGERSVHVWVPWKAMLAASLILTALLNVLPRLL